MKKVKVKFLDSIAGLGDPKPTAELDAKYAKMREGMTNRDKPLSEATIRQAIADMKLKDRYGEIRNGFPKDYSFKPGEEGLISETLAAKWEEGGICTILRETDKKAA